MIDLKEMLDYINDEQRAYKDDLKAIANHKPGNEEILNEYLLKWLESPHIRLVISGCTLIETVTESDPEYGLKYKNHLVPLLDHQSLQVAWRALAAIENFCQLIPEQVYSNIEKIIRFIDADSIVARDKANQVFAKLAFKENYRDTCLDLMFEQINLAADNQSGQYAERALKTIKKINLKNATNDKLNQLKDIMIVRLNNYTNQYHIKRMNKLLLRLENYVE